MRLTTATLAQDRDRQAAAAAAVDALIAAGGADMAVRTRLRGPLAAHPAGDTH